MFEISQELNEIAEALGAAVVEAKKFDRGNSAAGTKVRKVCHEARARLLTLRNEVSEIRKNRAGEKTAA